MLIWIIAVGVPIALLFFILGYIDKKSGKPYGINSIAVEELRDVRAYSEYAAKYLIISGYVTAAATVAMLVCQLAGILEIAMVIIIIPYAVLIIYLSLGKIMMGADKFYK